MQPSDRRWYVYALREPADGQVRYVGISSNPVARLSAHLAGHTTPLVAQWVRSLSVPPTTTILAVCDRLLNALGREAFFIKKYHSPALLNRRKRPAPPAVEVDGAEFGVRIKSLRKTLNYSQGGLAKAVGVSQGYLSRIESGAIDDTSATHAVRIARALNSTVEYLVTGEYTGDPRCS